MRKFIHWCGRGVTASIWRSCSRLRDLCDTIADEALELYEWFDPPPPEPLDPRRILTPSMIAKEALFQLENNLVMGNLVARDYERPE